MKVYLVGKVLYEEPGHIQPIAYFDNKDGAEEYFKKHNSKWTHWRNNDEYDTLRIVELEEKNNG